MQIIIATQTPHIQDKCFFDQLIGASFTGFIPALSELEEINWTFRPNFTCKKSRFVNGQDTFFHLATADVTPSAGNDSVYLIVQGMHSGQASSFLQNLGYSATKLPPKLNMIDEAIDDYVIQASCAAMMLLEAEVVPAEAAGSGPVDGVENIAVHFPAAAMLTESIVQRIIDLDPSARPDMCDAREVPSNPDQVAEWSSDAKSVTLDQLLGMKNNSNVDWKAETLETLAEDLTFTRNNPTGEEVAYYEGTADGLNITVAIDTLDPAVITIRASAESEDGMMGFGSI